jgi:hypothetical protein
MANPQCTFGECPLAATFTGTFFETGQSVMLCGDHFIDFAAGMLEGMTGIPVTALITLPPESFAEVTDPNAALPNVDGPTSQESHEVGTDNDQADDDPPKGTHYDEHDILVDDVIDEPATLADAE